MDTQIAIAKELLVEYARGAFPARRKTIVAVAHAAGLDVPPLRPLRLGPAALSKLEGISHMEVVGFIETAGECRQARDGESPNFWSIYGCCGGSSLWLADEKTLADAEETREQFAIELGLDSPRPGR